MVGWCRKLTVKWLESQIAFRLPTSKKDPIMRKSSLNLRKLCVPSIKGKHSSSCARKEFTSHSFFNEVFTDFYGAEYTDFMVKMQLRRFRLMFLGLCPFEHCADLKIPVRFGVMHSILHAPTTDYFEAKPRHAPCLLGSIPMVCAESYRESV